MKKALILAMAITLVLTGSLFAQGRLTAERNAVFTPGASIGGVGFAAAGPTTTNNDDSCDIGTTPAATLLLPYFSVNQTDRNTVFTVVNTSPEAQIAHVTVWTDWSFPVLDFNIYLTGYDVQGISLRDVIFNNVIAPTATQGVAGTTDTGSTTSGTGLSPYGPLSTVPGGQRNVITQLRSAATGGNPAGPFVNDLFAANPGSATLGCSNLPGTIPTELAEAIRNALINGIYNAPGFPFCATDERVGSAAGSGLHPANTAVGYVTIDVANRCSLRLPTDPEYFRSEILFDNVLTGDYETFDASAASNYAGGTPLVHIRAIPEGGAPTAVPPSAYTNLPYTFYSRYLTGEADPLARVRDRRQPLPSVWAARFVQGSGLNTSFKVWREGVTDAPSSDCAGVTANSALTIAEIVRFDEHENVSQFGQVGGPPVSPQPPAPPGVNLPEAAQVPVSSTTNFPIQPTTAGDIGGWMYMNLDFARDADIGCPGISCLPAQNPAGIDPTGATLGTTNNPLYPAGAYPGGRPAQSWVVVSMTGTGAAAGALSVDFDATWLGNGCSPNPRNTTGYFIGPGVGNQPAPFGNLNP